MMKVFAILAILGPCSGLHVDEPDTCYMSTEDLRGYTAATIGCDVCVVYKCANGDRHVCVSCKGE